MSLLCCRFDALAQSVKVSAVSAHDGVTVKSLTISTSSEHTVAYLYLPQESHKVAAVVFSHARIKSAQSDVDLLPFAESVAKAGAAVIVLNRVLDWRPGDEVDVNRRGGGLVLTAETWLLSQDNVDGSRFAYVGPRFHNPTLNDELTLSSPDRSPAWVPLGEPRGDGTGLVVDPKRISVVSQFLQRNLQLEIVK